MLTQEAQELVEEMARDPRFRANIKVLAKRIRDSTG